MPGSPHHVLQRGNNKQVVLTEKEDYAHYPNNLWEAKRLFGVQVYAYCLMTNHVHFLLNPGEQSEQLGKLMTFIAGRQTRYVNQLVGRTGTLWEERFKSSLIESERYLLTCCRYIERNPVRGKMVLLAEDYEWSSFQEKIGLRKKSSLIRIRFTKVQEKHYQPCNRDRAVCRSSRKKIGVKVECWSQGRPKTKK